MNIRDDRVINCLSSALFTFISTFSRVCLSGLPAEAGLGAATNSGTNICLSLSADEFLEVTQSGTTIERTLVMLSRQKLLLLLLAATQNPTSKRGRTGARIISATLDTNWSGTISTLLFSSYPASYI